MLDDPIKYGLLAALAIALLVAAFTDLRSRQIGNWLNGGIALAAPLFWWASDLAWWPDIALQLGVAFGTFAALAALFAMGAMGGGDVKLLAALALWIALAPVDPAERKPVVGDPPALDGERRNGASVERCGRRFGYLDNSDLSPVVTF